MSNSYLKHSTPQDRNQVVDICIESLKDYVKEFDTIVVTGISGLSIGAIVAYKLDKDLTIIRKDENTHSFSKIEGPISDRYIILDDFIARGDTIGTIIYKLRTFGFKIAGYNCHIPMPLPKYVMLYDPVEHDKVIDEPPIPFVLTQVNKHLYSIHPRKGVKI